MYIQHIQIVVKGGFSINSLLITECCMLLYMEKSHPIFPIYKHQMIDSNISSFAFTSVKPSVYL